MSGVGRRAGATPETAERAKEWALLLSYGVPSEKIAEREGVSRALIYRNASLHKSAAADRPDIDDEQGPDQAAAPVPAPPKKLGAATLRNRAMQALTTDGIFRHIPAELGLLWAGAVVEVHTHGMHGVGLPYRRPSFYASPAEFAARFGRTVEDLDRLFELGLLDDMDGEGVAIPDKFGLRPKPPAVRVLAPDRVEPMTGHSQPGRPPAPRQGFFMHAVPGGRESNEMPIKLDSESRSGGISLDSESNEMRRDGGISLDSSAAAFAAAAAAKGLESLNLGSSSSLGSRPRESNEIAAESNEIASGESNEIATGESNEIPPGAQVRPGLGLAGTPKDIARRLLGRARIARTPNQEEIERVRRWLAAGLTADAMENVVDAALSRPNAAPVKWLKYFDGLMGEEIARKLAPSDPAVPTAAAAAPLSAEDEARKALRKRWARVATMPSRHSSAPIAPGWEQLAANEAIGLDWLALAEAFEAAGFRGDKPPDWATYLASRVH